MIKVTQEPVLTLAISHNVHLTREQRYALAGGEPVSVVGVSVPVWYAGGRTNEPANEVFCNYAIRNAPGEDGGIRIRKDGYEFNLPQPYLAKPDDVEDGEWENLDPEKRLEAAEERHQTLSSDNLLDVRDGGSTRLSFSCLTHGVVRGVFTTVYHTVLIADVQELLDSLVT